MSKTRLSLCIVFTALILAGSNAVADEALSLSLTSYQPRVKLSSQNYSIKDLSSIANPSQPYPSLSSLSISKLWMNSSEWKLYSTHLISSPLLLGQHDYSLPSLDLSQNAGGFSISNRLSIRRRYSNALTLTPAIGLNMRSVQGLGGQLAGNEFYPLPISHPTSADGHLLSINTGIDLNGQFSENWGYTADLQYAYLANTNGNHAWKSEAMFFYQWPGNSRLLVGYKYINGIDNNQQNVQLSPVIDFYWSW